MMQKIGYQGHLWPTKITEISQGFSNTMQRRQRFLSIRDHQKKNNSRILDMLVDVHRSPSEIPMLWDIPQLYGLLSIHNHWLRPHRRQPNPSPLPHLSVRPKSRWLWRLHRSVALKAHLKIWHPQFWWFMSYICPTKMAMFMKFHESMRRSHLETSTYNDWWWNNFQLWQQVTWNIFQRHICA